MLNLTPHPITIRTATGDVTYAPSGTVARVAAVETARPGVWAVDHEGGTEQSVPVVSREWGAVSGLPSSGETCLVSSLVLGAVAPGTRGVYAPDTGPTAVRDAAGQIVAVTRLVTR